MYIIWFMFSWPKPVSVVHDVASTTGALAYVMSTPHTSQQCRFDSAWSSQTTVFLYSL